MSPWARMLVVAAMMMVALGVAWWARQGMALRRRRIDPAPEVTLPALFTSETCGSCGRARRILADISVPGLHEVVWERHPVIFEVNGITRVPVFMWVDDTGIGWRVDGVASRRRLQGWLETSPPARR